MEGLVGWDQEILSIPGVWLEVPARDESTPAALTTLPPHTLLGHVQAQFTHSALPSEALNQLLSVLYRLSRHSLENCKVVMSYEGLLQVVSRLFLPVRPGAMSHSDLAVPPNPLAMTLLRALAASSREHAQALTETADSLLLYVVALSAEPSSLEMTLVAETLRFYECLGRYGLYSSVAAVASEHFGRVLSSIQTAPTAAPEILELLRAFLRLRETWTVCATDPHSTTPEHDFLWSQVTGWDWGGDLLSLRQSLVDAPAGVHAELWAATSAWLEGCKVDSPRAGEVEKDLALATFLDGFRDGRERAVLDGAMQSLLEQITALQTEEVSNATGICSTIADLAYTLHQACRLALATAKAGDAGPLVTLLVADEKLVNLLAATVSKSSWMLQHEGRQDKRYALRRPLTALLHSLWALSLTAGVRSHSNLVAQCQVASSRAQTGRNA